MGYSCAYTATTLRRTLSTLQLAQQQVLSDLVLSVYTCAYTVVLISLYDDSHTNSLYEGASLAVVVVALQVDTGV
jgi:hypothetical protein